MIDNEQEIREYVNGASTMHDLLGSVGASDVKNMLAEIDALHAENAELKETVNAYDEENSKLDLANIELKAENARMRAVLEAVEWFYEGGVDEDVCPWCLSYKRYDHAPDCQRQLALGLTP